MLTATGYLAVTMLTNCDSSGIDGGKAIEANGDALSARQDWILAQRDSVADCYNFKTESADRVLKNSQIIADFKVRIMTGEKAMKARYQKRLAALEKKNNNMRNKLQQYSENGTSDCEIFKREWNDNMSGLVKALHDMTENNK